MRQLRPTRRLRWANCSARSHAHTVGNDRGLAVCLAGRFNDEEPTAEEMDVLRRVVQTVRRWATWTATVLPVVGHRDVPGNQTDCPGRLLRPVIEGLNATGSTSLKDALIAEATRRQVIQMNPAAALQQAIFGHGLVPNSPEFELEHNGQVYVAQRAERLDTGAVRIYYVRRGDWGTVQYVSQ